MGGCYLLVSMGSNDVFNEGEPLVEIVGAELVKPYDVRMGPIPEVVGGFNADGRESSGGDVVFAKRLDALKSNEGNKIAAWGNNHFDLSDLVLTFEDLVNFQKNSGFLKGILGVVNTQDGLCIAVDAGQLRESIDSDGWKYFKGQLSSSERVHYINQSGKVEQREVSDVVLLPYDRRSFRLTPDQFGVVKTGGPINRKNLYLGEVREKDQIVQGEKVVCPILGKYDPDIIVPFVDETFKHNKREYDYDTNFGLWLAKEPEGNAEGRALCVNGLDYRSGLLGSFDLGVSNGRSVGVVERVAGGDAPKNYRGK